MYKAGVYNIICVPTLKFYLGSSKDIEGRRWKDHRNKLRKNEHGCQHLQNAWNKYGEDAFVFNVIEHVIEPLVSAKQLTDVEQKWIDASWDTGMLFNKRPKAESCLGYKRSPEAIRKTAEGNKGTAGWPKGVPRSEETKRKLSEGAKGKPKSEEMKRNLSKAKTGKPNGRKGIPLSEAHKAKIGEGNRGKPSPTKGIPRSEETKRNISKGKTGVLQSEAHKQANSEGHKGQVAWNKGKKGTKMV
jgi:group I intron endonuclease